MVLCGIFVVACGSLVGAHGIFLVTASRNLIVAWDLKLQHTESFSFGMLDLCHSTWDLLDVACSIF